MMAVMEIHCPWQTWVAPSTSYLKASLDIVITYFWEITLSHFNINYSCPLGHPLHALHQHYHNLPLHACLLRWHVPFKLTALKHNQNEMRHHATAVPPPHTFLPFFDYVSQIFDGLVHPLKLVQIKNPFGILQTNPQIPREWVGNIFF